VNFEMRDGKEVMTIDKNYIIPILK
jgi:hypothetical protein